MTGRWLTYGQAREALAVTWTQLLDLLESGVLEAALIGDHYSIAEKSVSVLAARGGDLAESRKPAWEPWSSADDPDARDEQADYDDTPNEEGDDQQ